MVLALSAVRHADEQFANSVVTPLSGVRCTVGRGNECDIVLEDPTRHISRKHATILRDGDKYILTVESRINPVILNGQAVSFGQRAEINLGDSMVIGDYEFSVVSPPAASAVPAAAADPFGALGGGRGAGPVDLDALFGSPSTRSAPAAAPGGGIDALLGSPKGSVQDPLLQMLGGDRAQTTPGTGTHHAQDPLMQILERESGSAPANDSPDGILLRGGAEHSIDHLLGESLGAAGDPLGLSGDERHIPTDVVFGGGTGGSLGLDHVHDVHLPLFTTDVKPASPEDAAPRQRAVPAAMPAPEPDAAAADPLAALLGGASTSAGASNDPLGLFSSPAPAPPRPVDPPRTETSPYVPAEQLRREAPRSEVAPASMPAQSAAHAGGGAAAGAAIRTFLEGAGMAEVTIPDAEAEAFLQECGATVRAAVEGLMGMLLARAKVKEELRATDRTMVATHENNALKLIEHVDEALKFVFDPATRTEAFLPPPKAVADACADLQAHELALVAGMRGALMGAIKRFEPVVIEKRLEKEGGKSLLSNKKALLWDCFVSYYQQTEKDADDNFDRIFGSGFLRAYQEQIRRLKR